MKNNEVHSNGQTKEPFNNEKFIEFMRKVYIYHIDMILDIDKYPCSKCPLVDLCGKDIDCRTLLKVFDNLEVDYGREE